MHWINNHFKKGKKVLRKSDYIRVLCKVSRSIKIPWLETLRRFHFLDPSFNLRKEKKMSSQSDCEIVSMITINLLINITKRNQSDLKKCERVTIIGSIPKCQADDKKQAQIMCGILIYMRAKHCKVINTAIAFACPNHLFKFFESSDVSHFRRLLFFPYFYFTMCVKKRREKRKKTWAHIRIVNRIKNGSTTVTAYLCHICSTTMVMPLYAAMARF